ncbi:hypothetical protein QN360_08885, partial [Glaciimonas sp. CA11.2]|uniref:hypothetical protein n=1 Tax=Glaciimonas sp. CA11.2 TaxID=3048601 RepID=UPI002B221FB8
MADLDAFPWSTRRWCDAIYVTLLRRIYRFLKMGIIDIRASKGVTMLVKKSQNDYLIEGDMCQFRRVKYVDMKNIVGSS